MGEMIKKPAIGIDLGTTNSCVAISENGRSADVILNDEGYRTTPSCVTFTSYHHFIGDTAFNHAFSNPFNTVFDAKRLIGRKFDDEAVQKEVRLWPCNVVASPGCGVGKRPMFSVSYKDVQKKFAAEEISAMVLMKMKVAAEAYLHSDVKNVVVTVPAYFNNMQRHATKDAAIIAGFSGVRMINETTAAAIAYGLDKKLNGSGVASKNVLVYDLGGGTLDVALVTIQKDVFEVKSVSGNTHLGGRDFDFRMVRHFVSEFEQKHGKDISHNPRAMVRLRAACEKAKRNLSSTFLATIEIDCLLEGIDFSSSIARAQFESLNMDLFEECINLVHKCLKDAKMRKDDVHDVVLIGGSSRIPKVQQLLQEFFCGKELHRSTNPDEAVACGAAIYAANLSFFDNKHDDNEHIRVVDVTPLSIGVRVHSGIFAVVIEGNTPVPTRREKIYTTSRDFRTKALICLHESEILEALDDNLVGKFKISGIPKTRKRIPRIKISFEIDADGILKCSAEELMRGSKKGMIICYQSGRLSMEEVERMLNDAAKYKAADEQYKEKVKAMNALEKSAELMRTLLKRRSTKIELRERRKMGDAIDQTIQWLDQGFFLAEAGMFEDKMKELEIICEPIIAKMFDLHNSSPCSSGTTTKIEIINLDLG